ncbi:MAG: hypothetical protein ABJP02_08725 [Parasphingorhabdus sp.]
MALEHIMPDHAKARATFDEKMTSFDDRCRRFDQIGQKPAKPAAVTVS